VLRENPQLVLSAVVERLELLANYDFLSQPTPEDLVRRGLVDPVRVFVKNEPHTRAKLTEKRFRLISSVSLVDQVIERLIFGPQNKVEIANWKKIPSKPGMGLSLDSQRQALWDEVSYNHAQHPAAEADISGFDWSVQSWELWADLAIRINLGSFRGKLKRVALGRYYCFMNSVFQLSDGTMLSQGLPGLMKSGSYNTSSTNSRVRCLMAELIGSPWCIAMGDDSVEGYVPNAQTLYKSLGHTCKEYIPCDASQTGKLLKFNFCSHEISERSAWLTSWPKTVFRFLYSPKPDLNVLQAELGSNPRWRHLASILRHHREGGDKSQNGSSEEDPEEEIQASPEDKAEAISSYTSPDCQDRPCPVAKPDHEGEYRWFSNHQQTGNGFLGGDFENLQGSGFQPVPWGFSCVDPGTSI